MISREKKELGSEEKKLKTVKVSPQKKSSVAVQKKTVSPSGKKVASSGGKTLKDKQTISVGMVHVVQKGSGIRCTQKQRQTLVGLGLGRIGQKRLLKDTPEIRGMLLKVSHLVEFQAEPKV
ncbi:MAG: 50S ribosomal protein L30 [Holosporales bacterium]